MQSANVGRVGQRVLVHYHSATTHERTVLECEVATETETTTILTDDVHQYRIDTDRNLWQGQGHGSEQVGRHATITRLTR